MTEITKQDILKAFYRFDQKKMPLISNGLQGVQARIALTGEWLEALAGLDRETWENVVSLALDECREYPDIDKIYQLIERVQSQPETESAPASPPPAQPPAAAPTPAPATSGRERVLQAFAMAKQGDFKQAQALLDFKSNRLADARAYASRHWQSYSDVWIENNLHELCALSEDEKRCDQCMSFSHCKTSGYCAVPETDRFTKNVSIRMIPCSRRVKKNEKVQS